MALQPYLLLDAIGAAVVAVDASGMVTMCNNGAEQLLGYQRDELIGQGSFTSFSDIDESFFSSVEHNQDVQLTCVRKDGRRITVATTVRVLCDESGVREGFVCTLADVSGQRKVDLARMTLLQAERKAREQSTAKTDELMRINQMKDEFVATISHELRTPLTSIVGYAEMLLDGGAGDVNEDQKRFLLTIERCGERLMRLVDDLLFAARLDEGGGLATVFTEVDLAEIIDEAVAAIRPQADAKGIEIELAHEGPLLVAGDPARLVQLFDNFLSNAIKFSRDDTVVSLTASREENSAAVQIRDSGIGIPKDELPNLFQRFFRSRVANEKAIAGSGLGLAIAKAIADTHGASVAVDSELDTGTTISLMIPLCRSTQLVPLGK